MSDKKADKDKKRAEALRANLRRRKQAQRAKTADDTDKQEEDKS